jgi:type IV secretory pathway component VirB8
MNWDPNDWQGRTREQVERNNRVFGYSVIISIIVVAIALITLIII